MQRKKRFIAGAKCPKCHELDSLMLYKENDVEKIECVECGHKQSQVEESVAQATTQPQQVIGVFKP
ncbi:DNA-binding protein [Alteromonadales bacterium alter-6D02]|nr:DNA-binding protein [Alteromonadales bacterium alter-6D02]